MKTTYTFLIIHTTGLITSLVTYFKQKKKHRIKSNVDFSECMNYSLKLIIYFFFLALVVVWSAILPQGQLTSRFLKHIGYQKLLTESGSGGGFFSDPYVPLWLGILYYCFLMLIQILQLVFKEKNLLDLLFIVLFERRQSKNA